MSATDRLAIILVIATGALLLGFRLGWQGYWWDEEVTLMFTREGWHRLMIEFWGLDTHRPVYYGLQKAWNALAGDSVAATRALPALVMLLTVPVFWQIARCMRPDRPAGPLPVIATALLVSSPMFIAQGREIRMYCLVNLFLALSLWMALRMAAAANDPAATTRQKIGPTLGFALSLAGAFYAQSLAIFVATLFLVWAVAAVVMGWLPTRFLRQVVVACGVFSLAVLPALPPFLDHLTGTLGAGAFWVPEPSVHYIYAQTAGAYPYPKWTKPFVAVMILWGLWSLRRQPLVASLLALMVIGLPALVLAVSFLKPIYMIRVIAWGSLTACLVLASGVVALRPGPVRWAAFLGLLAAQMGALHAFYPDRPEPAPYTEFESAFATFDPATDLLVLGDQVMEPGLRWHHPELFEGDSYGFIVGDRTRNVIDAAFVSRFVPRSEAGQLPSRGRRIFLVHRTVPALPVAPQDDVLEALAVVRAGRQADVIVRSDPYQLEILPPAPTGG